MVCLANPKIPVGVIAVHVMTALNLTETFPLLENSFITMTLSKTNALPASTKSSGGRRELSSSLSSSTEDSNLSYLLTLSRVRFLTSCWIRSCCISYFFSLSASSLSALDFSWASILSFSSLSLSNLSSSKELLLICFWKSTNLSLTHSAISKIISCPSNSLHWALI
ncbi:hypothetical protein WICPIJ_005986 [Wickerhamomyces pijperi]|uniref:Uncharacterized protein n=1 Tax=Wickerhamomyces pijperi TaxID=599730 RepID=A0A9P8Q4W4_WICPI|nr:hypothetical protein WICPIJ_005986 [Wickerhamomyces pijperi]